MKGLYFPFCKLSSVVVLEAWLELVQPSQLSTSSLFILKLTSKNTYYDHFHGQSIRTSLSVSCFIWTGISTIIFSAYRGIGETGCSSLLETVESATFCGGFLAFPLLRGISFLGKEAEQKTANSLALWDIPQKAQAGRRLTANLRQSCGSHLGTYRLEAFSVVNRLTIKPIGGFCIQVEYQKMSPRLSKFCCVNYFTSKEAEIWLVMLGY